MFTNIAMTRVNTPFLPLHHSPKFANVALFSLGFRWVNRLNPSATAGPEASGGRGALLIFGIKKKVFPQGSMGSRGSIGSPLTKEGVAMGWVMRGESPWGTHFRAPLLSGGVGHADSAYP